MFPVPASLLALISSDSQKVPQNLPKLSAEGGSSVDEHITSPAFYARLLEAEDKTVPQLPSKPIESSSPVVPEPIDSVLRTEIQLSPNTASLPPSFYSASGINPINELKRACQKAFGTDKLLKWHIHDVDNTEREKKYCILQIIKSSHDLRTYKGCFRHENKKQAKKEVAEIALRDGALAYILARSTSGLSQYDNPVEVIESYFSQYGTDSEHLQWFTYGNGAALRVKIAPHIFRVYSTGLLDSPAKAKLSCAHMAIRSGVLDFIKDRPPEVCASSKSEPLVMGPITLQQFMDTLPRPFPESEFEEVLSKNVGSLVGKWLKTLLDEANVFRASALKRSFYRLKAEAGYGCLLRIEDPQEDPIHAKSYLVEPRLETKGIVKLAVYIQAMSEGIGNFLRSFIPEDATAKLAEGKDFLSMQHYVNGSVWPQLRAAQDAERMNLDFQYEMNNESKWGCVLSLTISDPHRRMSTDCKETRKYIVPTIRKSKKEARIVALYLAGHQGILQLLKDLSDRWESSGNPGTGESEDVARLNAEELELGEILENDANSSHGAGGTFPDAPVSLENFSALLDGSNLKRKRGGSMDDIGLGQQYEGARLSNPSADGNNKRLKM